MTNLAHELKQVIARHLDNAPAADVLSIVSTLCGINEAPLEFRSLPMVRPRFEMLSNYGDVVLNGGEIVRDNNTGLIWDRREFDSMTDAEFDEHIKRLNAEKFGGYDDWRKPEFDELHSLIDRIRVSPAIDTTAFPNCKHSWYRTSTPYAGSPSVFAWVVDFRSGSSYWSLPSDGGFVRAVRPSQ